MANGSGWNLWIWLAGGRCGWNLWVWLVGVVVRRYLYRFPHITYSYSYCICTFWQQHPYFLFIFKKRLSYLFVTFLQFSNSLLLHSLIISFLCAVSK